MKIAKAVMRRGVRLVLGLCLTASWSEAAIGNGILRSERLHKPDIQVTGGDANWGCQHYLKLTLSDETGVFIGDNPVKLPDGSYRVAAQDPFCIGVSSAPVSRQGIERPTLEVQKVMSGGDNPFLIRPSGAGTFEITESLHDLTASTDLPFLVNDLTCRSGACTLTGARCGPSFPKTLHPEAVDAVNRLRGRTAQDDSTYEKLVNALLLRALTGDPKAIALLDMEHPLLDTDGATGETWASAQETLKRARAHYCVK